MFKDLSLFKLPYSKEDIQENHIEGLLYGQFGEVPYKQVWKEQWLSNDYYLKEIDLMGEILSANDLHSRPILVKGSALLFTIYKDLGSRFMSDCDILIDPRDLRTIKELFLSNGYKQVKCSTWFANEFKVQLSKDINGFEINIELHTKLLYHQDYDTWNTIELNKYYDTLDTQDHVIYMCAHLAFAHSFLKLYWLFDIFLTLEENKSINYDVLKSRAKDLKVHNSLRMCFWVLGNFFDSRFSVGVRSFLYSKILNETTLWKVKQTGISYFLIKHLSKDSLFLSFKYDFLWALNKLFGR